MPNWLPPPRSAHQSSGFSVLEAFTAVPSASTTSHWSTLSHDKPWEEEEYVSPYSYLAEPIMTSRAVVVALLLTY